MHLSFTNLFLLAAIPGFDGHFNDCTVASVLKQVRMRSMNL